MTDGEDRPDEPHESDGGADSTAPARRDRARTWGRRWLALTIVLGAALAITALPLASTTGDVGPGRVSLRARWSFDRTTALVVPPLGRVVASTHSTPTAVEAQVEELDLAAVERLAGEQAPADRLREAARTDLGPLVRELAIRAVLIGLFAGALVGALLPRRRWTQIAAGAAAGGVAVSLLLGFTWETYSTDAFAEPELVGALQRAPDVLAAVEREAGNLEGLRDRVEAISGQLAELYQAAATPDPLPSGDEVRILHVSDLHLNPLGLEIVRDLAAEFDVHAVLDTGDFTTFGLPVEARFGELVAGAPVPYYLVPGNHDSPANRAAMDALANLTVVDGIVDIGGIEVLGVPDPTFTARGDVDSRAANQERLDAAPEIADRARAADPDILAVHDLRMARESLGDVALVVTGHTHERTERRRDGTLALTVASGGATGLGAFTVDAQEPYAAEILRFRAGRLVAYDYIELEGVTGGFRLDRVTIASTQDGR